MASGDEYLHMVSRSFPFVIFIQFFAQAMHLDADDVVILRIEFFGPPEDLGRDRVFLDLSDALGDRLLDDESQYLLDRLTSREGLAL